MMIKRITLIASLVFGFLLAASTIPQDIYAACYCAEPDVDNCRCRTPASEADSNPTVPAIEGGVRLLCDTAEDAAGVFTRKSPICGSSVEIQPYCAYHASDPSAVTCYGTGFTSNTGNVPTGYTGPWNPPGGSVSFNGFYASGINFAYICHDNVFCCASNRCSQDGLPELPSSCTDQDPSIIPPAEICGDVSVGAGEGESRLWFPHTRLISSLSTMGQSMFNPIQMYEYDELPTRTPYDYYFDSAFSKNATPEEIAEKLADPDGYFIGFETRGPITTEVTLHQGIDDSTSPIVNTSDNNSSFVVGLGAPRPLFSFGNTSDDNLYNDDPACFIPEDRKNPGDDLLGPKQQAEMMFTAVVQYEAHPAPGHGDDDPSNDCLFSGNFSSDITYGVWNTNPNAYCQQTCCSAICNLDSAAVGDCVWADPFETATCTEWTSGSHPYRCEILPGGDPTGNIMCCANNSQECQADYSDNQLVTGSCGTLPDRQEPVGGGESRVFTKTPMVEYMYETMLEADDSLWRRFMPYNPTYEFEDIPSSTGFSASAGVASPRTSGTILEIANGQTSAPVMYFPKIGTLHRYWLQEFQSLLRPEGFTPANPDVPGSTGSGSGTTGTCDTLPDSHPYCSVAGLAAAGFGDNAENASQICNAESGGVWNIMNVSCLSGSAYGFAVGLFQINLVPFVQYDDNGIPVGLRSRCDVAGFEGAFITDISNPDIHPNTRNVCGIEDDGTDCSDFLVTGGDPYTGPCNAQLKACIEYYTDPSRNINFAVNLSNGGEDFSSHWVAAGVCGIP